MNNLTKAYSNDRCEIELTNGEKLIGNAIDMFEFTNDEGDPQGYDVIIMEVKFENSVNSLKHNTHYIHITKEVFYV